MSCLSSIFDTATYGEYYEPWIGEVNIWTTRSSSMTRCTWWGFPCSPGPSGPMSLTRSLCSQERRDGSSIPNTSGGLGCRSFSNPRAVCLFTLCIQGIRTQRKGSNTLGADSCVQSLIWARYLEGSMKEKVERKRSPGEALRGNLRWMYDICWSSLTLGMFLFIFQSNDYRKASLYITVQSKQWTT